MLYLNLVNYDENEIVTDENSEISRHPILDTRFAKFFIRASYFGDFISAVYAFFFISMAIYILNELYYLEFSLTSLLGFFLLFSWLFAGPPAFVFYLILILSRAMHNSGAIQLGNAARICALIWLFLGFPMLVLAYEYKLINLI